MRFPAKNTSSCLWCRRTGGWTKGRTVTWLKVTTKISRMHGEQKFLVLGLRWTLPLLCSATFEHLLAFGPYFCDSSNLKQLLPFWAIFGVYKAIHGYKVPWGIGELLHERSTNYNLIGKHILKLHKVNTTTYGLKSWRYTAAKIWNALPDQFRAANKIGTFKNLMSKLDFSNFTF